jgi:hypothetical protein
MDLFEIDRQSRNAEGDCYALFKKYDAQEDIEIRTILQQWFDEYPCLHQSGLRKRFAAQDKRQHLGAFFELYCHQWLREQGYEVECLDDDGGDKKTPDYLVKSQGIPKFYMECTISGESDREISNKPNQKRIVEWIKKSGLTGLGLDVSFAGVMQGNPDKRDIIAFLKEKVSVLKATRYEEVTQGQEYNVGAEWTYSKDGVRFRLEPHRSEHSDDKIFVIGYSPNAHGHSGRDKEILKDLRKKAAKQKQFLLQDIPYVIALNLAKWDDFADNSPDDFTARTTLLGGYSVSMVSGEGRHSFNESFWFDPHKKPIHKSSSAVIWWQHLMPWNYSVRQPVIWHHPFADRPLCPSLFQATQNVWENHTLVTKNT